MDNYDEINRRLKRIEMKLFPENVITLYDYRTVCNKLKDGTCGCSHATTIHCNYKNKPIEGKNLCPFGMEDASMYIDNLWEHKDILFNNEEE